MNRCESSEAVVLIAADAEWQVVRAEEHYRACRIGAGPFEWFRCHGQPVVFVRSGCGKIGAAAAVQHAIDRWAPRLVLNLGTCGGFEPADVTEGEVILASRTIVYDMVERSGGQCRMEQRFTTDLRYPWLKPPYPGSARVETIVSADQDVNPEQVALLHARFGAVAGDWESAAVAHVAKTVNGVDCLILRVVSDLVSPNGGTIYGQGEGASKLFDQHVRKVFPPLLETLPDWLRLAGIAWDDTAVERR